MSMMVFEDWGSSRSWTEPTTEPSNSPQGPTDGLGHDPLSGQTAEHPRKRGRVWLGTFVLAAGVLFLLTTVGPRWAGTTMVVGESMQPTLHPGDIVFTRRLDTYTAGDIIVYRIPAGEPGGGIEVIHRIVGGDGSAGFRTIGDNRTGEDPWRPTQADIVGTPWRTIPRGGLVLLWFRSPIFVALLVGMAAVSPTMRLLDSTHLRRADRGARRVTGARRPCSRDGQ